MNVSKVKTDDVSQSESQVNQLLPIEVKTCDLPISDFRMLCSLDLELQLCNRYPIYFRDKVLNRTPQPFWL